MPHVKVEDDFFVFIFPQTINELSVSEWDQYLINVVSALFQSFKELKDTILRVSE